ncbi:MAG: hypothetical protein WC775_00995 [Patescibacteria group bacterium]|jgi:hypothetical protein
MTAEKLPSFLDKAKYVNQVRLAFGRKFNGNPLRFRFTGPYFNVIYRLGTALPIDTTINWFSSGRNATGGKVVFPYLRVDMNIITAHEDLSRIACYPVDFDTRLTFDGASLKLARTLVWLNCGWGGLENYAENASATINWTSGCGHIASPEKRKAYILNAGKKWIETLIVQYQQMAPLYYANEDPNDFFYKYGLAHLLKTQL